MTLYGRIWVTPEARANNAALLRLMVEIIRSQIRCRQHLPESEENREFDAHPNSKQRVQILLFVGQFCFP